MRILITIQHPAHVHFFRNAIQELQSDGHEVRVLAREKEIALELLDAYDIEYSVTAREHDGLFSLPRIQAKHEWAILKEARRFNPDVLTAIGEPGVAHVSSLLAIPGIIFTDTEHATLQNMITFPFAHTVCTPDCYQDRIKGNHITYPGYHELAYLHPNRYDPNPRILDEAGIASNDRFVILRTVAWNAAHDVGDGGFDDLHDVVTSLEATGVEVLITSEAPLPESVVDRRITVEPHRIHHLMYYADLFIGESATMATESAVLGTPAIFVSSSRRGYTNELEDEYRLVFNYSGPNRQINGLNQAISILDEYDKAVWQERREQLLGKKIDTTEFILDQITSMQS